MICFPCPECGFELEFGDAASGSRVRCPGCRAKIAVPELGALPADEAERIARDVAEHHGAKATLRRLGHFPPDLVANAAASFAHGLREGEVPLALIDTSLMQNGKAGLLITNRCLYSSKYHDPIPLEDITEVRYAGPTRGDQLALGLAFLIVVTATLASGACYELPAIRIACSLLSAFAALTYLLDRRRRKRRQGLLVNGELVYAGGRRRGAFWEELLETLGEAAREAQRSGDVPRPQRDFRTRVRQPGPGPTPRFITCEQCGLEYVSRAEGAPLPHEPADADALASDEARAWYVRLRADPRLVPCPGCGWCPRDVVARARRARHRWMLRAGLLLIPAAAFLFLVAYVMMLDHEINPANESLGAVFLGWFCFGVPALLAPGLLLVRFALNRRWDPNRAPAGVRRELGRERAVCLESSEPALDSDLPELEEPKAVRPADEESAGQPPAPELPPPPDGAVQPPADEDKTREA